MFALQLFNFCFMCRHFLHVNCKLLQDNTYKYLFLNNSKTGLCFALVKMILT
jgi:hypothetical protein